MINCNTVTNVTCRSALVRAVLDVGPALRPVAVTDTWEIQWGTVTGVYPNTEGPFSIVAQFTSSPIDVQELIPGLIANTQYFYRVVQRDAGAAVIDTSAECASFTTGDNPLCTLGGFFPLNPVAEGETPSNVPMATRPDIIPPSTVMDDPTADVLPGGGVWTTVGNATAVNTQHWRAFEILTDAPPCCSVQANIAFFADVTLDATTLIGSPANNTIWLLLVDGRTGLVIADSEFKVGDSIDIGLPFSLNIGNTPISYDDIPFIRVYVGMTLRDADGQYDMHMENFQMFATGQACYCPTCSNLNVQLTQADIQGTVNFAGNIAPQFIQNAWGTTPGGPYPNLTPLHPGTNSFQQTETDTIAGLTPFTNYYHVTRLIAADGVTILEESEECSFFTTIQVFCDAATGITLTHATFNGNAIGGAPGISYRFKWGTTSGGPYDRSSLMIPATATPENFSFPGDVLEECTTYYFKTEGYFDLGQVLIAESPTECSFTTECGEVWCGGLYLSGDCMFVPTSDGGYQYCSGHTDE